MSPTRYLLAAMILSTWLAQAADEPAPEPEKKPRPSQETIRAWVEELDGDDYATRQAASRRLAESGGAAVAPLSAAAERGSTEASGRALRALAEIARLPNDEGDLAYAALGKLALSSQRAVAARAASVLAAVRIGEQLFKRAAVGGKYRMLLHQIHCPNDVASYGAFADYGISNTNEWQGHRNLTAGYWVYAAPYWYIWRDMRGKTSEPVDEGPEQAAGSPDTPAGNAPPGDSRAKTAWTPAQDQRRPWLLVEFPELVHPVRLEIHEQLRPGALAAVRAYDLEGESRVVWQKEDALTRDDARRVTSIPCRLNLRITRLVIELAKPDRQDAAPGQIDAVGLVDRAGKTHWAQSAHAGATPEKDDR